jgi:hypothetical protein
MIYDHLPERARRLATSALNGAILLAVIVMLIYTYYAAATADDFCRASYPKNLTWLAHIKQEYMEWSGRWAVHSVYVLTFPKIGITSIGYSQLLLLSGPIWFVIFYVAAQILFGNAMCGREKAFIALILSVVFWISMPGPGETWYWLTGSTEYQLPFLLMSCCLLILTAQLNNTRNYMKVVSCLGAAVLAILVAGFNELIGLILLGLLTIGMILSLFLRRVDAALGFAGVLVSSLVGLAVNLLAPGTVAHAAVFSNGYNFLTAIRVVFLEPGQAPLQWLGQASMLWLTILLVTSPWFLARLPAWVRTPFPLPSTLPLWLALVPLIGLVAVHLTLFATDYAQGSSAPARTLDIAYAVFVFGWLASLIPLGLLAKEAAVPNQPVGKALHLIAAVMLPLSIVTGPNLMAGLSGLRKTAREFAPAVAAREVQMRTRTANASEPIELKPITISPILFLWNDITEDPEDWRNQCFARFYGVRAVRQSKP